MRHSPPPRSFVLRAAVAGGYAYLDTDVKARITLSAYFPTRPRPSATTQEITGPYDNTFEAPLAIEEVDMWTSCGTSHTLQARESVRVDNSTPPREGYLNLPSLDSIDSTDAQLLLTIEDRACEP